jgi:hypothetical protein
MAFPHPSRMPTRPFSPASPPIERKAGRKPASLSLILGGAGVHEAKAN